jgi:adenine phosphoribosyltransferase
MVLLQQKPSEDLRGFIVETPDFPKPGILFRDISPLLRHRFLETIQALGALMTPAEWAEVDVVGGVESRGFILASALAMLHGKGFVKIRKAGKLPGLVHRQAYALEYGEAELEMQPGSGRMVIVDDVLATGGTLAAAAELAKASGHEVVAFLCLIDLAFLNQFLWQGHAVRSLFTYDK